MKYSYFRVFFIILLLIFSLASCNQYTAVNFNTAHNLYDADKNVDEANELYISTPEKKELKLNLDIEFADEQLHTSATKLPIKINKNKVKKIKIVILAIIYQGIEIIEYDQFVDFNSKSINLTISTGEHRIMLEGYDSNNNLVYIGESKAFLSEKDAKTELKAILYPFKKQLDIKVNLCQFVPDEFGVKDDFFINTISPITQKKAFIKRILSTPNILNKSKLIGVEATLYDALNHKLDTFTLKEGIAKAWEYLGAESSVLGLPISNEVDIDIDEIIYDYIKESCENYKYGCEPYVSDMRIDSFKNLVEKPGKKVYFEDGYIAWYRYGAITNKRDFWIAVETGDEKEDDELLYCNYIFDYVKVDEIACRSEFDFDKEVVCRATDLHMITPNQKERQEIIPSMIGELANILIAEDLDTLLDSNKDTKSRILAGLSIGSNFIGEGVIIKSPKILKGAKLGKFLIKGLKIDKYALEAGIKFMNNGIKLLGEKSNIYKGIIANSSPITSYLAKNLSKIVNGKTIYFDRTYIPDAIRGNTFIEFKDVKKISLTHQLKALTDAAKHGHQVEIIISPKTQKFTKGAIKRINDANKAGDNIKIRRLNLDTNKIYDVDFDSNGNFIENLLEKY